MRVPEGPRQVPGKRPASHARRPAVAARAASRRGRRCGLHWRRHCLCLGRWLAPRRCGRTRALSRRSRSNCRNLKSAEAAAEQVNRARAELTRSQERLGLFQSKAVTARAELAKQQLTLEQLTRQLYITGASGAGDANGVGGAALTFALDDPDRFLSDLDRLATLSVTSPMWWRRRANRRSP